MRTLPPFSPSTLFTATAKSVVVLLALLCVGSLTARDWSLPPLEQLREEVKTWLETQDAASELRENVDVLWTNGTDEAVLSGERLDALLRETGSLASAEIRVYLDACRNLEWNAIPFGKELSLPTVPPGVDSGSHLYGSLRLCLAQTLVRLHLFDEALEVLDDLTADNTADPVAALLLRGVVHSRLMQREQGAEAIRQFRLAVETDPEVPRRYLEIAKLIEADLERQKKEKADDLQNIARKMNDVKRRLGTGKTGEKVQEKEKDVLESLDRAIEKIEKQMQEDKKDGEQGRQANKPADDSRILRQKGPGDVHDKDIGDSAGWGDLPPKEREEALLRMEKEFPSHYRAIIESYFREMAQTKE